MKKRFLVFLVLIGFASGCASMETVESTKVPATDIFQEYSITTQQGKTDVQATFRVANSQGATVDLDAPSKIELNGKEMREIAPAFMKGTDYHYSSNRLESNFQFAYTDAAGKIYRNEFSFAPLYIEGSKLELNRTETAQIPLSRAVAQDENVYCRIVSEARPKKKTKANANINSNAMLKYSADTPATLSKTRQEILIDAELLKKFAPGKAYMKLRVGKQTSLKEATSIGGRVSFKYESPSVAVNVLN